MKKLASGLLPGLLLVACHSAAPEPLPSRAPTAAPLTVDAAPPAARWVRANRGAQIGPTVPGGVLVLLGGRRAVVAPDGHVTHERVAAPEALLEVAAVSTHDGPVIVGLARRYLYRFDDPLGAAVRIAEMGGDFPWLEGVRDGVVEIAHQNDVAGFDPRTGARVCGDDPRDHEHEAKVAPPACPPNDTSAQRPARAPTPGRDAPLLLRWIAATGADPLLLAVTDGVRLDARTAVVASSGLVARVELEHGTVTELVTYTERRPPKEPDRGWDHGPRDEYGPCEGVHAGNETWLLCPWIVDRAPTDGRSEHRVPFGVLKVRSDNGRLLLKLVRTFETFGRDRGHRLTRSSLRGGLVVGAPCDDSREAMVTGTCVRKPDGSWSTFAHSHWWQDSPDPNPFGNFVPLRDGRVASVFGAWVHHAPHIETLAPAGEPVPLPPIPIPSEADSRFTIFGLGESDGALDLAFGESHAPPETPATHDRDRFETPVIHTGWLARQPLDGSPASVRVIPDATFMGLGEGHAIAAIRRQRQFRVVISNDGGATLSEEEAPGSWYGIDNAFVNDVGAFLEDPDGDGWLRIGWGALGQTDASATPASPQVQKGP